MLKMTIIFFLLLLLVIDVIFCGYNWHPRNQCLAKDAVCLKCKEQRHDAMVCRSVKQASSLAGPKHSAVMLASIVGATPNCLEKSVRLLKLNGRVISALVDSGSLKTLYLVK